MPPRRASRASDVHVEVGAAPCRREVLTCPRSTLGSPGDGFPAPGQPAAQPPGPGGRRRRRAARATAAWSRALGTRKEWSPPATGTTSRPGAAGMSAGPPNASRSPCSTSVGRPAPPAGPARAAGTAPAGPAGAAGRPARARRARRRPRAVRQATRAPADRPPTSKRARRRRARARTASQARSSVGGGAATLRPATTPGLLDPHDRDAAGRQPAGQRDQVAARRSRRPRRGRAPGVATPGRAPPGRMCDPGVADRRRAPG